MLTKATHVKARRQVQQARRVVGMTCHCKSLHLMTATRSDVGIKLTRTCRSVKIQHPVATRHIEDHHSRGHIACEEVRYFRGDPGSASRSLARSRGDRSSSTTQTS